MALQEGFPMKALLIGITFAVGNGPRHPSIRRRGH
jgi:hypothetical protein